MKKIYTTLLLLIGIYANAQLTMIKDVAAAGITPTSGKTTNGTISFILI